MKKTWMIIYAALVPVALISGYRELSPAVTAGTNADWVLITVTFVSMLLFPLGAVAYGFSYSKKEKMARPTWDRPPLAWWTDTLQSVRFTLVYTSLVALGALFALPHTDDKGRMLFFFLVAMPAGIFGGERLAYVVYKKRIAD